MATTGLPRSRTINFRHDAVQCEQLKDNTGAAINVSDLTNSQAASVANGATLVLVGSQNNKTILLDTAAGTVTTLPASSGSNAKYKFYLKTPTTSSGTNVIQVANGTDVIQGAVTAMTDTANAALVWPTTSTSDTITLNHGSKGGTIAGEWLELQDVAAGFWAVRGVLVQSGTEGTPFSAAVS